MDAIVVETILAGWCSCRNVEEDLPGVVEEVVLARHVVHVEFAEPMT